MDTRWVKIRSWHALRSHDPFGPSVYCGNPHLKDDAETLDELPTAKSCESCLRSLARLADDDAKAD